MIKLSPLAMLFLLSCGPADANPCATKSATYLSKMTETSGTCGTVPDTVVNITSDGRIPAASGVTCESREVDGCTLRTSACKNTANGVTCTSSGSVTFQSDGSQGSGLISISCAGGATCASSYSVTYTRQ